MKGKRFKEEQIIRILHEAERGLTVAEVCRQHNCSEQSFYRWKAKFGGMEVSDVKRLRELHRENTELKKIVAEQTLNHRSSIHWLYFMRRQGIARPAERNQSQKYAQRRNFHR